MLERSRKVLIVDDDDDTRLFVHSILTAEGWAITEAANGQEALDRATEDPPDLILLDLVMPVMDGFHAFKALRTHHLTKQAKIIIFSNINSFIEGAHHTEESIEAEYNVPRPDGFVDKPVDPFFLLAEINGVMG